MGRPKFTTIEEIAVSKVKGENNFGHFFDFGIVHLCLFLLELVDTTLTMYKEQSNEDYFK
jgi:hypothetical protein